MNRPYIGDRLSRPRQSFDRLTASGELSYTVSMIRSSHRHIAALRPLDAAFDARAARATAAIG